MVVRIVLLPTSGKKWVLTKENIHCVHIQCCLFLFYQFDNVPQINSLRTNEIADTRFHERDVLNVSSLWGTPEHIDENQTYGPIVMEFGMCIKCTQLEGT